jgi:hypothetical protein
LRELGNSPFGWKTCLPARDSVTNLFLIEIWN